LEGTSRLIHLWRDHGEESRNRNFGSTASRVAAMLEAKAEGTSIGSSWMSSRIVEIPYFPVGRTSMARERGRQADRIRHHRRSVLRNRRRTWVVLPAGGDMGAGLEDTCTIVMESKDIHGRIPLACAYPCSYSLVWSSAWEACGAGNRNVEDE
jgi:hypothetical protein